MSVYWLLLSPVQKVPSTVSPQFLFDFQGQQVMTIPALGTVMGFVLPPGRQAGYFDSEIVPVEARVKDKSGNITKVMISKDTGVPRGAGAILPRSAKARAGPTTGARGHVRAERLRGPAPPGRGPEGWYHRQEPRGPGLSARQRGESWKSGSRRARPA